MERVEKELEATVRQPANAEKYRMEQIAEAKRQKVILEAEAEAEAIRVKQIFTTRSARRCGLNFSSKMDAKHFDVVEKMFVPSRQAGRFSASTSFLCNKVLSSFIFCLSR